MSAAFWSPPENLLILPLQIRIGEHAVVAHLEFTHQILSINNEMQNDCMQTLTFNWG
jgi:hypothetical protein